MKKSGDITISAGRNIFKIFMGRLEGLKKETRNTVLTMIIILNISSPKKIMTHTMKDMRLSLT